MSEELTPAEARLLEILTYERRQRDVIGAAVLQAADAQGGYLHLRQLGDFELPDGYRMRLIDAGGGGIWNPQEFSATLTITTSPDGPYADHESDDGILYYKYQGQKTTGKNTKLRLALEYDLPVIRFQKIAVNYYTPIYPVYVIADDPTDLTFQLAVDRRLQTLHQAQDPERLIDRAYAQRVVRARVHQPTFRAAVLLAYGDTCAICTLKHPKLLDAAHIIRDADDWGEPVLPNGLSLCKIHHAAYDNNYLGIDPAYRVHVNAALLKESDGPMLKHGLQEMHGRALHVPHTVAQRPDPERLHHRFLEFSNAA